MGNLLCWFSNYSNDRLFPLGGFFLAERPLNASGAPHKLENRLKDPMSSLENFRIVVFRAVAEQRSFRKAAEELYLSQPAVSLQIKALEEDLGVQLFDRTGAHITLTKAGRVLLGYSQQSRVLRAQAEHEIAALSGEHSGHLALGASTTIAQYVLPRLLAEFRCEHPRVYPTLISGNTEQIVNARGEAEDCVGIDRRACRSRDVKTEAIS